MLVAAILEPDNASDVVLLWCWKRKLGAPSAADNPDIRTVSPGSSSTEESDPHSSIIAGSARRGGSGTDWEVISTYKSDQQL